MNYVNLFLEIAVIVLAAVWTVGTLYGFLASVVNADWLGQPVEVRIVRMIKFAIGSALWPLLLLYFVLKIKEAE